MVKTMVTTRIHINIAHGFNRGKQNTRPVGAACLL